jgi:hypothetical protein
MTTKIINFEVHTHLKIHKTQSVPQGKERKPATDYHLGKTRFLF